MLVFDSKNLSDSVITHSFFLSHHLNIHFFAFDFFYLGTLKRFLRQPYTELTASDYGTSLDYFGGPIALEGNTAAITAMYNENSGSVYIFEYDNGEWTEKQKLCGDDTRLGDRERRLWI